MYNANKRKVLHIVCNNNRTNYSLNGTGIPKVNEEKDLGETINSYLKPGKHSSEVVKTTNKLIGFIV